MSVRSSAMPRFIECASSAARFQGEVHYDETHPEGQLGNAVHEALAKMVDGDRVDLMSIANKHDIHEDNEVRELGKLYAYGRKTWRELREWLPDAKAEVPLEGPVSRGTADVLHHDGETCVVVDWKSGWVRRSAGYQVMSYASGARAQHGVPASEKITTIVVWLRFGEYDVADLSESDIEEFEEIVRRRLKDVGTQYAVTEHCTYCPRRLVCRARHDYMQSTAALVEGHYMGGALVKDDDGHRELSREDLGSLYLRARMLEAALKEYFKALRVELLADNTPIQISDDRAVKLGTNAQYRIDARAAWPILLLAGFSDEEINRTLKMKKKVIEDVAMNKAPPKHKTKARNRLLKQLEEAGALHKSTYPKFQLVKAK